MLRSLKFNNISNNLIKFSTKSNVDIIKNLNYENKALFGPVIKKNNKKKNTVKGNTNNGGDIKKSDEISRNSENSYDSERYWLIENKSKKVNGNEIKFAKNERQIETKSLAESLNGIKSTLSSKQNRDNDKLESRSSSIHEIPPSSLASQSKSKEVNDIPFDDTQLRSILKFPLILNETNCLNVNNLISITNDRSSLSSSSSMKLPSVGKILQATMPESSRKALINWKLSKIAELGEEGFNNLQNELLQQGKLFHRTLQEYLESYKTPTIDPSIDGVWNSVTVALESLKPETKLIEAPIEHPYLKYCGIVDYVSYVRSNLSVIEWKKSNKIKNRIDFTYDAPIQLCAYLGALSVDPKYKIEANNGFVIVAYTNGQPAQIHHLDKITLQKYWNLWLHRLQEYWIRLRDGTIPEPI